MLMDIPYISFFTSGVQAEFWQNLGAVLFVAMPLVVIWAATELGGNLLSVIRNAFRRDSYGKDSDDDRDYDI